MRLPFKIRYTHLMYNLYGLEYYDESWMGDGRVTNGWSGSSAKLGSRSTFLVLSQLRVTPLNSNVPLFKTQRLMFNYLLFPPTFTILYIIVIGNITHNCKQTMTFLYTYRYKSMGNITFLFQKYTYIQNSFPIM